MGAVHAGYAAHHVARPHLQCAPFCIKRPLPVRFNTCGECTKLRVLARGQWEGAEVAQKQSFDLRQPLCQQGCLAGSHVHSLIVAANEVHGL